MEETLNTQANKDLLSNQAEAQDLTKLSIQEIEDRMKKLDILAKTAWEEVLKSQGKAEQAKAEFEALNKEHFVLKEEYEKRTQPSPKAQN